MPVYLFVSVGDSAARRVVGGDLYRNAIPGEDPNVKLAHFATDGREDPKTVIGYDAEHGVWQRFVHDPRKLHLVVFGLLGGPQLSIPSRHWAWLLLFQDGNYPSRYFVGCAHA